MTANVGAPNDSGCTGATVGVMTIVASWVDGGLFCGDVPDPPKNELQEGHDTLNDPHLITT